MSTSKLESAVNGKSNDVMQMKNDKFGNVWWRKVALAVSALNRRDLIGIWKFRVKYDKLPETRFNHGAIVGLTWTPRSTVYGSVSRRKSLSTKALVWQFRLLRNISCLRRTFNPAATEAPQRLDEVAKIYKKKIRSLSYFIVANSARSGLCGGSEAREAAKEEKKFSSAGKFVSKGV